MSTLPSTLTSRLFVSLIISWYLPPAMPACPAIGSSHVPTYPLNLDIIDKVEAGHRVKRYPNRRLTELQLDMVVQR